MLVYTNNGELEIIGYVDYYWVCSLDDMKSILGYVFKLVGEAISWNSVNYRIPPCRQSS